MPSSSVRNCTSLIPGKLEYGRESSTPSSLSSWCSRSPVSKAQQNRTSPPPTVKAKMLAWFGGSCRKIRGFLCSTYLGRCKSGCFDTKILAHLPRYCMKYSLPVGTEYILWSMQKERMNERGFWGFLVSTSPPKVTHFWNEETKGNVVVQTPISISITYARISATTSISSLKFLNPVTDPDMPWLLPPLTSYHTANASSKQSTNSFIELAIPREH